MIISKKNKYLIKKRIKDINKITFNNINSYWYNWKVIVNIFLTVVYSYIKDKNRVEKINWFLFSIKKGIGFSIMFLLCILFFLYYINMIYISIVIDLLKNVHITHHLYSEKNVLNLNPYHYIFIFLKTIYKEYVLNYYYIFKNYTYNFLKIFPFIWNKIYDTFFLIKEYVSINYIIIKEKIYYFRTITYRDLLDIKKDILYKIRVYYYGELVPNQSNWFNKILVKIKENLDDLWWNLFKPFWIWLKKVYFAFLLAPLLFIIYILTIIIDFLLAYSYIFENFWIVLKKWLLYIGNKTDEQLILILEEKVPKIAMWMEEKHDMLKNKFDNLYEEYKKKFNLKLFFEQSIDYIKKKLLIFKDQTINKISETWKKFLDFLNR